MEGLYVSDSEVDIPKGETALLNLEYLPESATETDVVWTSENTSIANVTDGVVKGKRIGTTTIVATSAVNSDIKTEYVVNVVKPLEQILTYEDLVSYEMNIGETRSVIYHMFPFDASNVKKTTFESSNSDIVSVDENGIIKANNLGENGSPGTATIV